ncbi:C2 domain-containing protein [Caenorhabditis elegans]|uniref:C2 domain-containing protein n=2 Tax=Caenorhabditis elegans TaxID=6239 RepID=A0A4V0IJG9_CAEEL|nr:C2 domain-containing protein [Caenorhabditis elegans]VTW47603.1 C2 domain-containing protein [Caenorhabditis elegans]
MSDEDADEYDDQSSISSVSDDDDFSGSESESYQDTTESTGPSEATTDEMLWGRRRAPVCGIAAQAVRRQILMNQQHEPNVLGNNKKVYQTFGSTPQLANERHKEMYSQIRRGDDSSFRSRDRFVPPRRPRMGYGSSDLSAIELQEMSPIRSSTYSSSSEAHRLSSLRAQTEWKPQLTSTTTSFQPLSPMNHHDKENGPFKAPMSPVCSSTPRSQRMYRKNPKYRRQFGSSLQLSESRLEESTSQESERAVTPESWMEHNNENEHPDQMMFAKPKQGSFPRPEAFGLDNAYAKHKDIRGIIFLSMSLCGRRLTLNVQNAAYFCSAARPTSVCSYVSAVLCHRPSSQSSSSSRQYRQRPDECYRTRLVTNCNSPSFDESFYFTFSENCVRDLLIVTVYEMDSNNAEKKRILGCMTFPVSRILKKASQVVGDPFPHYRRQDPMEDVEINNEGFFLLNKDQGRKQNFPQRKVRRQTFYEDPAFTGVSSAGSSVISNNTGGQMTMASPRLSVPNELTMGDYYRSTGSSDMRGRSTNNLLDYTSASSSTNGSAGGPEKLKLHRATLPSITTTTSENNSDDAKSLSPEQSPTDHHFLCPDDNGGVYGAGPAHSAIKKSSVRRAASFTFSPKHSSSKTNLRQLNGREEDKEKKRFLGPISRTLSYLRSKMDLALSTSSLYPSRDDVRQWEISFESLLNNKFGCALFRQFLKKEFSDENMDFWLECEEFKKMKDGKKSTTQKAIEIYSEFVAEHSPKEVNLDSDTRAATKAAVEAGCKPDTFALAQSRVEQLMSKDSYRRFLRDRLFLDLLESYEITDKEDKPSSSKDKN